MVVRISQKRESLETKKSLQRFMADRFLMWLTRKAERINLVKWRLKLCCNSLLSAADSTCGGEKGCIIYELTVLYPTSLLEECVLSWQSSNYFSLICCWSPGQPKRCHQGYVLKWIAFRLYQLSISQERVQDATDPQSVSTCLDASTLSWDCQHHLINISMSACTTCISIYLYPPRPVFFK